jgi:hypothetical protein
VNSSSIQLSSVFDSPQNDLNSLSPTSNWYQYKLSSALFSKSLLFHY